MQVHPSLVQRNLCSDFERDSSDSSSVLLPPPSAKETIQVYLRVKPKTSEESEISSASGSLSEAGEGAGADVSKGEDEDGLIKIESDYQVSLDTLLMHN